MVQVNDAFELARVRVIMDFLKRSSESTRNVPGASGGGFVGGCVGGSFFSSSISPSTAVSRSFSSEIIEQAENKLRKYSMNRFSEAKR